MTRRPGYENIVRDKDPIPLYTYLFCSRASSPSPFSGPRRTPPCPRKNSRISWGRCAGSRWGPSDKRRTSSARRTSPAAWARTPCIRARRRCCFLSLWRNLGQSRRGIYPWRWASGITPGMLIQPDGAAATTASASFCLFASSRNSSRSVVAHSGRTAPTSFRWKGIRCVLNLWMSQWRRWWVKLKFQNFKYTLYRVFNNVRISCDEIAFLA